MDVTSAVLREQVWAEYSILGGHDPGAIVDVTFG